MAWETRGGSRYYTRTRRLPGGRFVREYIGVGLLGELAEAEDLEARRIREEARRAWREEVDELRRRDAAVAAFCEETDLLLQAALLAAGYHRHARGAWRRRRKT
jgi:hypothetical protein